MLIVTMVLTGLAKGNHEKWRRAVANASLSPFQRKKARKIDHSHGNGEVACICSFSFQVYTASLLPYMIYYKLHSVTSLGLFTATLC